MTEIELENLCYEGIITHINGKNGSGKTDIALALAAIASISYYKKTGKRLYIFTNISLVQETRYRKMFKNDLELLTLYSKHKGPKVTIFDEGGVFANNKDIFSPEAKKTEKLVILIRKFKSALFYISQSQETTLPEVQRLSRYRIYKRSRKYGFIELRDYNIKIPFKNMPASIIPFNTYAIASMEYLLNFKKIFNELSNLDETEKYKKLSYIVKNYKKYLAKSDEDFDFD